MCAAGVGCDQSVFQHWADGAVLSSYRQCRAYATDGGGGGANSSTLNHPHGATTICGVSVCSSGCAGGGHKRQRQSALARSWSAKPAAVRAGQSCHAADDGLANSRPPTRSFCAALPYVVHRGGAAVCADSAPT